MLKIGDRKQTNPDDFTAPAVDLAVVNGVVTLTLQIVAHQKISRTLKQLNNKETCIYGWT